MDERTQRDHDARSDQAGYWPGGYPRRRLTWQVPVLMAVMLAIVSGTGYWVLRTGLRPPSSSSALAGGSGSPAPGAAWTILGPAGGKSPGAGSGSPAASPSSVPPGGQVASPAAQGPSPITLIPPSNVIATASGPYQITVTWTQGSAGAVRYDIDNGCPIGSCGGADATLTASTAGTSATFTVTPGTYQCFRVRALSTAGGSGWSSAGCAATPGLTVPATRTWTDSGVSLAAGQRLGLTATGTIRAGQGGLVGPAGTITCVPRVTYPASATSFPAPALACWSLIGRIGTGPPFEVGASNQVITTSGELYLGVNADAPAGDAGAWTVRMKLGGLPPVG